MKRTCKICAIGIIVLLLAAEATLAGPDTVNIAITCTIPAIAGLNAPLVNEKDVKNQQTVTLQQQANDQEQVAAAPVKHQKGEMILAEKQTGSKLVKTIYSR